MKQALKQARWVNRFKRQLSTIEQKTPPQKLILQWYKLLIVEQKSPLNQLHY